MTEQEKPVSSENNADASGIDRGALEKELEEQKAKAEANLTGWQRAQADFSNYKRRTEQEKEDAIKFANANLILRMLPVLDDLERAVASLPPERKNAWADGFRHIERKLRTSLEAAGLSPILALGLPFDPRFHEAVKQDKGTDGVVIAEMERGYKLQDRVIRPSRVVVGNGEETEPAEGSEQE